MGDDRPPVADSSQVQVAGQGESSRPDTRERAGLRLLALAIPLLAVGALAIAPPAAPPVQGLGSARVTQAALGCPGTAAGARRISVASATVAGAVAVSPGQAELAALPRGTGLVALAGPDIPASISAPGGNPDPVLAMGHGGWAAALLGGQVNRVGSGRATGLASVACAPARAQWWFIGGGAQLGRRDSLIVGNPADTPSRLDIELLGRDGPVVPVAGRGIEIGARSQVELRLDALAPDEDLLAINLKATAGQVTAALLQVAAEVNGSPRGSDFIGPSAEPQRDVVIAGIPGGAGRRTLVLANPGEAFATATVTAITTSGAQQLTDLATVAVPGRTVVRIDVTAGLAARPSTLRLQSDQPISGSLQAVWGSSVRESLWLAGSPMVGGAGSGANTLAGAAAVPAGDGLQAQVTVVAPQQAAFGTLTIISTGDGGRSPFSPQRDVRAGVDGQWGPFPATGGAADDPPRVQRLRMNVPAGTQRQLTLASTAGSDLISLNWVADSGSGPAYISHTVLSQALAQPDGADDGEDAPLATGYQWWPTVSAVPTQPVLADPGVLGAR